MREYSLLWKWQELLVRSWVRLVTKQDSCGKPILNCVQSIRKKRMREMISLKDSVAAFLALVCFSCYSNAEEFIEPGSDGATQHTIYDDGRVQIDLPFDYTLGGQTFITSWMYSNGVVGFLSAPNGMVPHFCCSGQDVAQMAANGTLPGIPYFNYSIAALWTDLIDLNVDVDGDGVDDSGFFTKELDTNNDGQVDTLRYYWRYISEFYSTEALNSFGIEITDANTVEIHHFFYLLGFNY